MPSPRIRRLQSEHTAMLALTRASSMVSFVATGTPPTQYDVTLHCLGLCDSPTGPRVIDRHELGLLLEADFPFLAPALTWKTEIFHPNFRRPSVCMGDLWYPAWSVAEMCVALCEMVQYKTFNIYDPLDVRAAAWLHRQLEEHPESFPVDRRNVLDLDFEVLRPAEGGADEV